MALALLNIFADTDSKKLYKSFLSLDPATLQFFQGESPPVAFRLMTPNIGGPPNAPWTLISPAQYALKIGLFLPDGTQIGFQDTFTDDAANSLKYAQFTFNSALIDAAIIAIGSPIICTFEAEMKNVNGSASKIQQQVVLTKQCITPSAATVAAPEVPATQAFAKSLFIPKDGSDPMNQCNGFIMLSRPGNIPCLVYPDDAGVWRCEPQGP